MNLCIHCICNGIVALVIIMYADNKVNGLLSDCWPDGMFMQMSLCVQVGHDKFARASNDNCIVLLYFGWRGIEF